MAFLIRHKGCKALKVILKTSSSNKSLVVVPEVDMMIFYEACVVEVGSCVKL